jgi:ACT domain-containing protein
MSNLHTEEKPISAGTNYSSSATANGNLRLDVASHARLGDKLGIDDASLQRRREFIRLGDAERELLIDLIPWSEKVAATMARDFYDWQFTFGPTRIFFEQYAASRKLPLDTLRRHLEGAQIGYYKGVFAGARNHWDGDYFEGRLHVGWLHDQINLPFKWYLGAYAEWQRLTHIYLVKSFSLKKVAAAESAIFKVFNLDMQAVGDSFLLSVLASVGLQVESIEKQPGTDRTEYFVQVKRATSIMLQQAEALADMRLTDPVFDAAGKNVAGDAFERVRTRLSKLLETTTSMVGRLSNSSQNVQTSTEQMTASIGEIARNATESARVASSAVQLASTTNQVVSSLGESSAKIGQVLKVITTIAQQTGEAGKGFAVVANEVKELAKETAKATEDIGRRIEAIQSDANNAVDAIGKIGAVIDQIHDISNTIAGAVEEQTAVTNEIARSMTDSARVSTEVVTTLSSVLEGNSNSATSNHH